MGASLAAILAILGMKEVEPVLCKEIPKDCKAIEDLKCNFPERRKKISIGRMVLNEKMSKIGSIKIVVTSFKKWNKET